MMSWREIWEEHAEQERAKQDITPVSELLKQVEQGDYGNYYGIWKAIAKRAKLKQAGWILFAVLERDIDYLHRYHCAEALVRLLGRKAPFTAVELSADIPERAANIARLRELLEQRLGSRQ